MCACTYIQRESTPSLLGVCAKHEIGFAYGSRRAIGDWGIDHGFALEQGRPTFTRSMILQVT